jgi:hypothetical protein
MNTALLQKLIDAGTPTALVAEVAGELAKADAASDLIETRRARDRERKARKSTDSAESTEIHAAPSLDKKPQTQKIKPTPRDNILPACEALDLPEGVSPELWVQYRAMRRRIHKPMDASSEQFGLKRLRAFAEDGWPPGEIVEAAIAGNYQGLFKPTGSKNGRPNEHPLGKSGAACERVIADMDRDDRARDAADSEAPPGPRTNPPLAITSAAGSHGSGPH